VTSRGDMLDRFRQLSRALQWALYALIGLVLFLGWDEYVRPIAARWNEQADTLQQDYESARGGRLVASRFEAMQDPIVDIGPVSMPDHDEDAGRSALTKAVNEVLKGFSVSNLTFDVNVGQKLKKTDLPAFLTGTRRVSRLLGTLNFEAAPADATGVIAALESHADIECVRFVRVTTAAGSGRSRSARLKVKVMVESWMFTADARGGPRG
jgi:hypothetical protein